MSGYRLDNWGLIARGEPWWLNQYRDYGLGNWGSLARNEPEELSHRSDWLKAALLWREYKRSQCNYENLVLDTGWMTGVWFTAEAQIFFSTTVHANSKYTVLWQKSGWGMNLTTLLKPLPTLRMYVATPPFPVSVMRCLKKDRDTLNGILWHLQIKH
jgi:hypothetical protein